MTPTELITFLLATHKKKERCLVPQPNLARNLNARKLSSNKKKTMPTNASSRANGAPFSSKPNLHEAVTCNHDAFDRVFPIFLRFEGGEISRLVIERSGTPKNVHLFVIH